MQNVDRLIKEAGIAIHEWTDQADTTMSVLDLDRLPTDLRMQYISAHIQAASVAFSAMVFRDSMDDLITAIANIADKLPDNSEDLGTLMDINKSYATKS